MSSQPPSLPRRPHRPAPPPPTARQVLAYPALCGYGDGCHCVEGPKWPIGGMGQPAPSLSLPIGQKGGTRLPKGWPKGGGVASKEELMRNIECRNVCVRVQRRIKYLCAQEIIGMTLRHKEKNAQSVIPDITLGSGQFGWGGQVHTSHHRWGGNVF